MNLKRILSGVQPTGVLHLGNYLGAIKKWSLLINSYHKGCFEESKVINSKLIFFIADNHSITTKLLKDENTLNINLNKIEKIEKTENEAEKLNELVKKTAACLIASGIDFKKCIFFRQSDVKYHTELMWILSCITPQSWLNTMIQFKEKSKNNQLITSIGLYSYPILMAADILIYNAEIVPVGNDQIQHMQLTKDIAVRLNKLLGEDFLKIPQYELDTKSARIMSLVDGKKKMSKSDENKNSCVNLLNSPEEIKAIIMRSKTDSNNEIYYDNVNRPEVSNLINIYSVLSGLDYQEIKLKFIGKSFKEFKIDLTEYLIREISPISEKALKLIESTNGQIEEILDEGRNNAEEIAKKNLSHIKKLLHY